MRFGVAGLGGGRGAGDSLHGHPEDPRPIGLHAGRPEVPARSAGVKCNYAYLEAPRISGANGMLQVSARFSGRSAMNVLGMCIGLGDAFETSITALPYYQDGTLRLKDVQVVGKGRDGYYIRRVCAALAESLARSSSPGFWTTPS